MSKISLKDLSPEDRMAILQEAREIIDQENIEKNASAMYAMKKKELVENTIKEMKDILKLRPGPDVSKLRDRFVHMSNYLYGMNFKEYRYGKGQKITNASEWELFQDVCNKVKECIIHSIHYNKK